MAKAKAQVQIAYTLVLSEEEYEYLKGLLQNDQTAGETEDARKHREAIFSALANANL